MNRLATFEQHRRALASLAYRMLGDWGRAEDLVQDAWLRWSKQDEWPDEPKAYLITIVTRLCLNELDSARARKEEARADRLPEPVDLARTAMAQLERMEQVSMAFLVMLQRLTPLERAVLLLHDVFDFEHKTIAELIGKNEGAARKALERARKSVADEKRLLESGRDEHRRLLRAFMQAALQGDVEGLKRMLIADAVLITDGGTEGREAIAGRTLPKPLEGADKCAAFIAHSTRANAAGLTVVDRTLNDQPAVVLMRDGQPFAAILLAVADGKIERVYFHADKERLGFVLDPVARLQE